jgi:hypothetical protein
MITIPPRLKYYYDLKPGKYIRFGQNNAGQCYLSTEETDRAAFLRTQTRGDKKEQVWKWLSIGGHEGYISDLMVSAHCYPYSDELYQHFEKLADPELNVAAYAFLHPDEKVDAYKHIELVSDWAIQEQLDELSDDYWDHHYQDPRYDDPGDPPDDN